jgi:hypothetical protein
MLASKLGLQGTLGARLNRNEDEAGRHWAGARESRDVTGELMPRILLSKALPAAPNRAPPQRDSSTTIDTRLHNGAIGPPVGLIGLQPPESPFFLP